MFTGMTDASIGVLAELTGYRIKSAELWHGCIIKALLQMLIAEPECGHAWLRMVDPNHKD